MLTSVITITGCSNSTEQNEAESPVPQLPDQTTVADSTFIQAPAEAAPGTTMPMTMTTQPAQQPQQQAASPSAAGMNPAHGEPGHRCDIAVGAPLNSPAGNNQDPAMSSPPVMQMTPPPGSTTPPPSIGNMTAPTMINTAPSTAPATSPTPAATTTAPGMNPPHGQPGHDCAIAVGAPLKK